MTFGWFLSKSTRNMISLSAQILGKAGNQQIRFG